MADWLSDFELNQIKEKSMGVTEESDENGCESSVGFGKEGNSVCGNGCHVVLEDTCPNQDRSRNNDERGMVTRMALRHGTVLQENENDKFEQLIMSVYKKEKEQLNSLRGIRKEKVNYAVNKVSCVLKKIDI